jgi:two-component system response regulator YesN
MHDAVECIYLTNGRIRIYIDGHEDTMNPGDFVLFRSRGIHSIYTDELEINDYYCFKIATSHLHSISPKNLKGQFALRFSVFNSQLKFLWRAEELEGSRIKRGIDRIISDINSPGTTSDIAHLVSMLDILEAVYRETEDSFSKLTLYSNQVYRAIVYVNENFEDSFTEEEIAAKFGMSYGYFSRSFKAATGKTFRDYVISVRINHAEYLIINSDLPIAHIATKCGYSNVSHFIQIYKKLKGVTPLQLRKAQDES